MKILYVKSFISQRNYEFDYLGKGFLVWTIGNFGLPREMRSLFHGGQLGFVSDFDIQI